MRAIVENRTVLSALVSAGVGLLAFRTWPFPAENALLQLVLLEKPYIFYGLRDSYIGMLFSTPYIVCSILCSLAYIFAFRRDDRIPPINLPSYPDPAGRDRLSLVVGEVHHPKKPVPVENPAWLTIPERGLYTGIAVFGAIGSGKTSGCMYPFADQLLAYRAQSKEHRTAALVLEVKGDFCHKVRTILEARGRGEDYIEVSLESPYRYNPLHNDLDAYTLAYGIASLLNNLFGKSKEPFWQQAYTNLVKFIILLHKVLYDYVTLFDVYEGAINPDILAEKIKEGERLAGTRVVRIHVDDFMADRELENYPFECDSETGSMQAPFTEELRAQLEKRKTRFKVLADLAGGPQRPAWNEQKLEEFAAVKRWFYYDWLRIEPRLRTSIVEGVSVFLSLFDDNPQVKRIFCPPKEVYDPVANADGRYGKPLPPLSELMEKGAVCALNFPAGANPGLAKTIGVLLKQDFQRAMLNRIPRMERHPERPWRGVLFLCDEYQSFATVGENDPSGDEKFFALSRQAKCIPIIATHSISSLRSTLPGEAWRTLLQTFRTKIFLALSDDFSARTASDLCGKEEQLKLNYSLSETGQDAGISVLTGRATAHRAAIGTSKGYNVQRDFVFEPKVFSELKNAQAIILAYDGLNPWPPSYCYLKPFYLDNNTTYFEQLAKGEI